MEDNLFKVPRACFERSFFDIIFTLPAANNTAVNGSDDDHPFKIEGIKKVDFLGFLKVLYPQ